MDALTALRTVNELSGLIDDVASAASDAEFEINGYWARDLDGDAQDRVQDLLGNIDSADKRFRQVRQELEDIAALLTVLRPIWEAVNPNLRGSAWVWDELARIAREL